MLLFNFVGFELPSSAGEEMTNPQRDVPFGIARSAVASVVLYALPVIGILIVLPTSAITNFSGFVSAIQDVFTVYGGHVTATGTATLTGAGLVLGDACAILFILCLLTSGVTWIMGSDRALAVSCYDGAGPRFLGVINARYGTPVRVNVFSGIVATIVVVLAHQITSGNAAKYFDAVLGVTISTTLISYLLIYPALWKLRRSHPDTPRPFRMPCVPAADGDPDGPGGHRQHPAHRPRPGQLVVRQRLHPLGLDLRPAVHLPVDRAAPGAGLHRHRDGLLVDGPPDPARGGPGPVAAELVTVRSLPLICIDPGLTSGAIRASR